MPRATKQLCLIVAGLLAVCVMVSGAGAAQKAKGPTLGPWHLIGPFPTKEGGFATVFPPELAVDLTKPCGGKKWEAHPEFKDGIVQQFQQGITGPTYLYRTITADAPATITGYFGSDDGLEVWLNGKKLISKNVPRGAAPNQDTAKLELQAGENRLLLKIYNNSGDHAFYFSTSPNPSSGGTMPAPGRGGQAVQVGPGYTIESLRRAVTDLNETFGARYPKGRDFLARLDVLEKAAQGAATPEAKDKTAKDLADLAREALLANPLIDFDRLLVVKRNPRKLGLPQNWQGNSTIGGHGYDNEIAALTPVRPDGALKTLYRPPADEFVGDLELHFDGDRMLFSMPGTHRKFQIFEIKADGTGLRQVTPGDQPDVDNYDACYLPDGRIIFCSTACYLGVPCVGGGDSVGSLYLLDEQSKKIRQLTFDQDHSWCPTVLNNGRVIYTRWEYSDTPHYFSRLLFEMNPDGTAQFEYYGSNSYWPNSTFYARPIPGHPSKVVGVVSGHHGQARSGELLIFDSAKGRREADGIVQRIPGYGQRVEPIIRDGLVDPVWPKFLHPYPLSDKYFVVSCQTSPSAQYSIYLVDIFDNMLLLREEQGYALLEPVPLRKTARPPVIPDRVKLEQKDATVYLVDVYQGGGLKGVPRGTVKKLRVYSDYFAPRNMGGHIDIAIDGPWDGRRMLGTVPVNTDGSAMFKVPANVPIVVQPLDAEGKAVQVMRSWYTAMPGEFASCVGCHEPQTNGPPPARLTQATTKQPSEIEPWYGPARPFGFEREVQQPVLEKFCVSCHNGQARPDGQAIPDFRAKSQVAGYRGKFTPAYEALHPYVRRPGPESDYHLPNPCEYHADTSELVQLLRKGHHGVKLDAEGWDRLITWIDLNVPCHGTWGETRKIPGTNHQRRLELAKLYDGTPFDPEEYPAMPVVQVTPVVPPPEAPRAAQAVTLPGWPMNVTEVQQRQSAFGPPARTIELSGGVTLELVRIPAGEFVMGDQNGFADERPLARVTVAKPFWMGRFEITNQQFAAFDPTHDSGYISVFNKDQSTRGEVATNPRQPAIRVTWQQAAAFCQWLSKKTGEQFTLPTEAQWEYACRAGTATPLSYGDTSTDFAKFANLADQRLNNLCRGNSPRWIPSVPTVNDGAIVTENVGKYQPNLWGLHDMHGNVAEWTRSLYRPYPYRADDGREAEVGEGLRVVRGGSFWDRPLRARSAFRLGYPAWQAVYNVGFRVIAEVDSKTVASAKGRD